LPRSRSHNGPTNPRNKPQTILKRKNNSRSNGLSCPATTKIRADRPHGYDVPSASCGGLSEKQSRTSSTTPSITDRPRWAREPSALRRTVRHSSTDRPRTLCKKIHRQNGSNERHARTRKEHEEHLGCQAPREPSAMPSRAVCQEKSCSPSPTC
jgi:hypothetical protein